MGWLLLVLALALGAVALFAWLWRRACAEREQAKADAFSADERARALVAQKAALVLELQAARRTAEDAEQALALARAQTAEQEKSDIQVVHDLVAVLRRRADAAAGQGAGYAASVPGGATLPARADRGGDGGGPEHGGRTGG